MPHTTEIFPRATGSSALLYNILINLSDQGL
jgi:hypothetical protein